MKKALKLLDQIQQLNPTVKVFICQWEYFNLFITTSKNQLILPSNYFLDTNNFICSYNENIKTSRNYLVRTTDELVEVLIKLREKNPKANLALFKNTDKPLGVIVSDTPLSNLDIKNILNFRDSDFLYIDVYVKGIKLFSKRNKLYFKKQTLVEKFFNFFN